MLLCLVVVATAAGVKKQPALEGGAFAGDGGELDLQGYDAQLPSIDDDAPPADAVAPAEAQTLVDVETDYGDGGSEDDADAADDKEDEIGDERMEPVPVLARPRASCQHQRALLETKNQRLTAEVAALSREVAHLRKLRAEARHHAAVEANELSRLRAVVAREEALAFGASPPADAPTPIAGAADARAPAPAVAEDAPPVAAAKVHSGKKHMPWLLTHTGTRHRMQVHAGARDQSLPGTMESIYNRLTQDMPSISQWTDYNSLQNEQHEAVTEAMVNAELQRTREDLGRAEEEKHQLETRLSEVEGKEAHEESVVQEDEGRLAAEQDHEKALEAEAAEARRVLQQEGASSNLHDGEAHHEMEAARREMEAKLRSQMQANEALRQELKAEEQLVDKLENKTHELEGIAGTKAGEETHVRQQMEMEETAAQRRFEEQQKQEEQELNQEAKRLRGMESAEERCMSWGKRLEAKLQHVLSSRKNDARLCRDSILSLHEERQKLKQEFHHIETQLAAAQHRADAAEKQSGEDQGLLSRCLDQLGPR